MAGDKTVIQLQQAIQAEMIVLPMLVQQSKGSPRMGVTKLNISEERESL